MRVAVRLRAVEIATKYIGVTEHGGNNRGKDVAMFQAATDLGGTGWPWCAAFVMFCLDAAGYNVRQIRNRASVGFVESFARAKGYLVERPLKGDVFCWRIDSNDSWPDHTSFVEKVLGLGPILYLQTIEGNTGSMSADDGDGVWRKRRFIRKSRLRFIRFPGTVQKKVVPKKKKPDTFWTWARWYLGRSEFKGHKRDPKRRPNVPKRVPAKWWSRLNKKHVK